MKTESEKTIMKWRAAVKKYQAAKARAEKLLKKCRDLEIKYEVCKIMERK